jgi:hypothetical protein
MQPVRRSCYSHNQFYATLRHERSEHWYNTLIWHQRLLSIMYDIVSLTNSTFLTADMILLCRKKNLYLIHDSHSPFRRKMCILLQFRCHRPPIWPPILSLNLTYILMTLLTLSLVNLPCTNLISMVLSLGRLSKESVQVQGSVKCYVTSLRLWRRVASPTPDPQAGGSPIVICPRLLIKCIRSYPP